MTLESRPRDSTCTGCSRGTRLEIMRVPICSDCAEALRAHSHDLAAAIARILNPNRGIKP